jgi:hypothetical protein
VRVGIFPYGNNLFDDPAGKGGEYVDGGSVGDHGFQWQKVAVHQDGCQVIEGPLVKPAAEHVLPKTRTLRGKTLERLTERQVTLPAHGYGTLPDPFPEGTRKPKGCLRHGHSGWVHIPTETWTTDKSRLRKNSVCDRLLK